MRSHAVTVSGSIIQIVINLNSHEMNFFFFLNARRSSIRSYKNYPGVKSIKLDTCQPWK